MNQATRVFVRELRLFHKSLGRLAVLDQVVEKHGSSLVFIGDTKAHDLVYTVVNGIIQLLWAVCGHDYD